MLSWMRRNGEEIIDEDIARLSPMMHRDINTLGHYTFTLPEDILESSKFKYKQRIITLTYVFVPLALPPLYGPFS
nr:hypothetical protein [Escherichia coli]